MMFTVALTERERIVLASAVEALVEDARHKGWKSIDVFDDKDTEEQAGADAQELLVLAKKLRKEGG